MTKVKQESDLLMKKNSQANQRTAFFLAYLVECADANGVIRKTVRQVEGDLEKRRIFMGTQPGIWIHTTLTALLKADVIEKIDRLGRMKDLQRTVMGLHYFIKLRNPVRIERLLDKIPKLKPCEADLNKIRQMNLEDDPHVLDEESEIGEEAFEKALDDYDDEELPF